MIVEVQKEYMEKNEHNAKKNKQYMIRFVKIAESLSAVTGFMAEIAEDFVLNFILSFPYL